MDLHRKIVPVSRLLQMRDEWRARGKRVVLCQGCFDLLHKGHVHLLSTSRELGDILIVAINSDESAKKLKGPRRPIVPVEDRAVLIAALVYVDYVTIFDTSNATDLVTRLQPDVYVDDSSRSHLTVEAKTISEYGGQLAVVQRLPGYSTTDLIQRVVDACGVQPHENCRETPTALTLTMKKHIIPNVGYYRLEAHELLIRDIIRIEGFQAAINKVVRSGDIVLDLGTGTGILSFLASQAGARHIYAIEREQVIGLALLIAKHNDYTDRIEFIECNSNELSLPQQVDVLISDCIGSFGLNTMAIDDFFRARDNFLRPGGHVIPVSMALYAAPFASEMLFYEMSFWRTPRYGIDFSPICTIAGNQVYVVLLTDHEFLASPQVVHRVDFISDTISHCSSKVCFTIKLPGQMIGICGWFDVELTNDVQISTSPDASPTSWFQVVFPLCSPVSVVPGDEVSVSLANTCHFPLIEWRWNVTIHRSGKEILRESHSSRDGFPRYPSGLAISYYPSF